MKVRYFKCFLRLYRWFDTLCKEADTTNSKINYTESYSEYACDRMKNTLDSSDNYDLYLTKDTLNR